MTRARTMALGAALLALAAGEAQAQWNVARFASERRTAYSTFGMDPSVVGTLGAAQVVTMFGRDVQLSGDVAVGMAKLDARDFRARVGAHASLVHRGPVHLTGRITAIARGTDNSIYRGVSFGADLAGTLGVYRPRWFAAGELGFDKAVVTHIAHSDWYREHYYPDAKDGWYVDTGGTYRLGMTAGFTLGRSEIAGRFGWLRTERWNELASPMHASVGVGVGF